MASKNVAKTLRAAFHAFRDPTRAELVAEVGERTSLGSLRRLLLRLRSTPAGQRILSDRPCASAVFPPIIETPVVPVPTSQGENDTPTIDTISTMAYMESSAAWGSLAALVGYEKAAKLARMVDSNGSNSTEENRGPSGASVPDPLISAAFALSEFSGAVGSPISGRCEPCEPCEPWESWVTDGADAMGKRVRGPLVALLAHPRGTFGRAYGEFLAGNRFDPLGRPEVSTLPELIPTADPDRSDLLYISGRLRHIHDYLHVLTGLPPTVSSESMQKGLEWGQGMGPGALAMWAVGGNQAVDADKDGKRTPLPLVVRERMNVLVRGGAWVLWHHASLGHCDVAGVYYEELFGEKVDTVRRIAGLRPAPRLDERHGYDVYHKK